MKRLTEEQLETIKGGYTNVNGSLISAFVGGIQTFMDIGRSVGTAIRYFISGYKC